MFDFFSTEYQRRDASTRKLCDYTKCPITGDKVTINYKTLIPDVGDVGGLAGFLGQVIHKTLYSALHSVCGSSLTSCFA